MNKKKVLKDIFDISQHKWVQGEIINNKYIQFKGWSDKWNIDLDNIPNEYIEKAFTYTKRFRPKLGEMIQIKITNNDKKDIYDFKMIKYYYNDFKKYCYYELFKYQKNIWTYGLVINKSGKFISVLYIHEDMICIVKVKRDSNIVCEKNTHTQVNKNIFSDIFIFLKNIDKIKNLKCIFLNNLEQNENISDYLDFDFILELIIDNINYFKDNEQKISFLKMILLYNKKFEKRCYFELAHLYMCVCTNQNKKIIFRYLCLSEHTNIAIKYIQNKMILENSLNDPIDFLYDLLI